MYLEATIFQVEFFYSRSFQHSLRHQTAWKRMNEEFSSNLSELKNLLPFYVEMKNKFLCLFIRRRFKVFQLSPTPAARICLSLCFTSKKWFKRSCYVKIHHNFFSSLSRRVCIEMISWFQNLLFAYIFVLECVGWSLVGGDRNFGCDFWTASSVSMWCTLEFLKC